jgi:bifunctional DNA-binding transcriptional regulator/antitoxin component of YhaV-PrlF toxin-antitoxin module
MNRVTAMVSESGRLSLPADMRRALGLEKGGKVVITLENNELRIMTPREGLRRAQEISRKLLAGKPNVSVDDFIAERRREAEREEREFGDKRDSGDE